MMILNDKKVTFVYDHKNELFKFIKNPDKNESYKDKLGFDVIKYSLIAEYVFTDKVKIYPNFFKELDARTWANKHMVQYNSLVKSYLYNGNKNEELYYMI